MKLDPNKLIGGQIVWLVHNIAPAAPTSMHSVGSRLGDWQHDDICSSLCCRTEMRIRKSELWASTRPGKRDSNCSVIPYQNADVAVPKCGYVRYPLCILIIVHRAGTERMWPMRFGLPRAIARARNGITTQSRMPSDA
jgi:hypothetical protein